MTVSQAASRTMFRKGKTKEAIGLAMESRWQEAVDVNQSILELFPDDVESYNRLGRAYMQIGNYVDASASFRATLHIAPSNAIAKRNLVRIGAIQQDQRQPKCMPTAQPEQFLAESGKTGVVILDETPTAGVIAMLTAGESASLTRDRHRLLVENADGLKLGRIPPRTAKRLLRLLDGGNAYEVILIQIQQDIITVLIRETYQHPTQRGISSFPARNDQLPTYPLVAPDDTELLDDEQDEITIPFSDDWDENGEDETQLISRRTFIPEAAFETDEEYR